MIKNWQNYHTPHKNEEIIVFRVEKLVRGDVLNLFKKAGIITNDKTLSKDQYILCLQDKLLEEAQELINAIQNETRKEIVEEFADVFEALDALIAANKISQEEITQCKNEKISKRGDFYSKIYCEFVAMSRDNPNIEYYLKRSDKYPIIEKIEKSTNKIVES